ncbi:MAG: DUF4915 domain-containing protein [Pseudomonadota bacterium]
MALIITPWKPDLTHRCDGAELTPTPNVVPMGFKLGARDYARIGGFVLVASTHRNGICEMRPQGEQVGFTPIGPPSKTPDQYHVNGLATDGDVIRYATMCGLDWRADRTDGRVYDCQTNRPLCTGLNMPHSPRLHRGTLWVCNSERGTVGTVTDGCYEPFAHFNGFPRGLAFDGHKMFVGVSRLRGGDQPCGIATIDLQTGAQIDWQTFEQFREIFVLEIAA